MLRLLFYVIIILSNISFADTKSDNEVAGITALMNAVMNNDIDGVKFFATKDIDTINNKNIGGATALHLASRRDNTEILKILLENKAKINIQDAEGWTALMRASIECKVENATILLDNGANLFFYNDFDESAIIYATNSRCPSLVTKMKNIILTKYKLPKIKLFKENINKSIYIASRYENSKIKEELTNIKEYLENIDNKKHKNIAKNNNEERISDISENKFNFTKPKIEKSTKEKVKEDKDITEENLAINPITEQTKEIETKEIKKPEIKIEEEKKAAPKIEEKAKKFKFNKQSPKKRIPLKEADPVKEKSSDKDIKPAIKIESQKEKKAVKIEDKAKTEVKTPIAPAKMKKFTFKKPKKQAVKEKTEKKKPVKEEAVKKSKPKLEIKKPEIKIEEEKKAAPKIEEKAKKFKFNKQSPKKRIPLKKNIKEEVILEEEIINIDQTKSNKRIFSFKKGN